MKKHILRIALAIGLLALPAASFATPPGQWFVSGQIGQSKLQGSLASNENATGSALDVGYRWNVDPEVQVGVEAGYAHIGSFKDQSDYMGGYAVRGKLQGAMAGANAKFNFTPDWYLLLEGGLFSANQKVHVSGYGIGYADYNHTKISWYSGVGFGYDFNNNVGLGLNYNYYKDDDHNNYDLSSSMISMRLEVRF